MTLAQERDIWQEYQHATGEERARLEEELASRHFRLVYVVVNNYRNSILGVDEVESAATYGLLKAIRKYKHDLGFTFSTYAVRVMKNEVWRLYRKTKKAETVPLESRAFDDGEMTLAEMVHDPDAPEPDENLIVVEFMRTLSELNTLTEDERTVLDMRLNREMSQIEVANVLGIWQNSVSRIEKRAKLKVLDRLTKVGLVEHHDLPERQEYPLELVELAKENGISYTTLVRRINRMRMDPIKAATTPISRNFKEKAAPIIRDGLLKGLTGREIRDRYFPGKQLNLINKYSSDIRKRLKEEGLL